MTVKMIIDTLRVLTTAFLIFAGGCFFKSFCKASKNDKIGNAVCTLFMTIAAALVWIGV